MLISRFRTGEQRTNVTCTKSGSINIFCAQQLLTHARDGRTTKCRDTIAKEEDEFHWKDIRTSENAHDSGSEDEPEIEPDFERGKPGTSKAKKARQDSFKKSLEQWGYR